MTSEAPQLLRHVAVGMAMVRVLLGLLPFVAAGPLARLLGFPPAHDSPTARLLGRFFGVRDIALGVLVWHALADPAQLRFAFLFNACCDAGDGCAILIPLLRRQGIDRAALLCLLLAAAGGAGWLVLWLLTAP